MKNIKVMVDRLKNPIVLVSIVSQILIILSVFKTGIDADLVTKVTLAIGSILVSLGIVNNPSKNSVNTEELLCSNCLKFSKHVLVNGKHVCEECGCVYEGDDIVQKKCNRFIK